MKIKNLLRMPIYYSPFIFKDGELCLKMRYKGKSLFFFVKKENIFDVLGVLNDVFINQAYGELAVKGKTVVDVGAFLGDTSIYFIKNGAEHVYSFEPFSSNYNLAQKNIRHNGLKDKITLSQIAIMGKKGTLEINKLNSSPANSIIRNPKIAEEVEVVPAITLQDIIEKYPLKDSVLKLDCEEAEYEIIESSSPKTLRFFSQIFLEYDYKIGEDKLFQRLKQKLIKSGFGVTIEENHETKTHVVGYVFAERKENF